ncbi:MAG: 7-carboxy-7-deazaguanine synthase QueE [Patescibacteria group bacterium]|nr:7-carboxy-7-deazaguanine synthase QueE [Patescibacteria group bacterium]
MDQEQVSYPVAEVFESIQGEGYHAGRPMTFIRLAGCSVGKPYTKEARQQLALPIYQERCTDWQGNSFICDTDFRMKFRATVNDLVTLPEVESALRVCLTGGEPLMHDIWPLIKALDTAGKKIHVETSGTCQFPYKAGLWMAVSPKEHVLTISLDLADEIKILVGPEFDEERFVSRFQRYFPKVWLQPINGEHELNEENVRHTVALVQKYKLCRMSTQLHKVWRVR